MENNITIIRACAGAGKTRRIVEHCQSILESEPGNDKAVVVTLTNSVRAEITERLLQCCPFSTINKVGNHDILSFKGTVEVTSSDAFIHSLLLACGFEATPTGLYRNELFVAPDDFDHKRSIIGELIGSLPRATLLTSVFGEVTGTMNLFMDEFQDLDDIMCGICARVSVDVARSGGGVLVVGDSFQNVFGKSSCCSLDKFHEMVRGNTDITIGVEAMNVCHRCPPSHIDFVNEIFPERQMKHSPKLSGVGSRPCLLAHSSSDPEASARSISLAVEEYIRTYNLSLGEVAIVASTTNKNAIFAYLERELNYALRDISKGGPAVKWFITSGAAGGIDWSQATDRIAMLSVHADKGKTHRLCVFVNVSEGVIPKFSGSMAVEKSLLFVGLTRSSEHMLVTFGGGTKGSILSPNGKDVNMSVSRYIRRSFSTKEDLSRFCDWSHHSQVSLDQIEWVDPAVYSEDRVKPLMNTPCSINDISRFIKVNEATIYETTQVTKDITSHKGLEIFKTLSLDGIIPELVKLRLRIKLSHVLSPEQITWYNLSMGMSDHSEVYKQVYDISIMDSPGGELLWKLGLVILSTDTHTESISQIMNSRPWAFDHAISVDAVPPDVVDFLCDLDRNCKVMAEHIIKMFGGDTNVSPASMDFRYSTQLPCMKAIMSSTIDILYGTGAIFLMTSVCSLSPEEPSSVIWNNSLLKTDSLPENRKKNVSSVAIVDVCRGKIFNSTPVEGCKDGSLHIVKTFC